MLLDLDPTLGHLHLVCTPEDPSLITGHQCHTTGGPHMAELCTLAILQWVTTPWPPTTQDRQVRERMRSFEHSVDTHHCF